MRFSRHIRRKWAFLAALTTGASLAAGFGCLKDILAIAGATFF